MKHLTHMTQFLETLSKIIIVILIAINSALFTAIYINYNLPLDNNIQIINRYLNYPDKSVYTDSDIQLIVYGDVKYTRK